MARPCVQIGYWVALIAAMDGDGKALGPAERRAFRRPSSAAAFGLRSNGAPLPCSSRAALVGATPAAQTRDAAARGTIAWLTDGDTFRLASGERIRIAGIDAPETQVGQAKCQREIERGKAATARARGLLQGRAVDIARVGRSYRPTVARLTLDGRDLGDLLAAEGIARRWPPYKPKPDWCRD